MSNLFNSISSRRPKKNVFDLSHDVKLTMNMGDLIPMYCQEVVPGDRFRIHSQAFVRMAPMIAPIMHNVNVFMHYFFVPNRLVWSEWESFITGGKDGTSDPVFPRVRAAADTFFANCGPRSLADYLGVGIGDTLGESSDFTIDMSLLPFRAYQLIYNEYYRDQNLTDGDSSEFQVSKDSGIFSFGQANQTEYLFQIRKRCWEHDYFTSALPWTQRGADVTLPGVTGFSSDVKLKTFTEPIDPPVYHGVDGFIGPNAGFSVNGAGSGNLLTSDNDQTNSTYFDPNGTLEVDVPDLPAGTINEFRRSIRLQEWLEKNARGGSRYIEQILSHFGVRSSDARLQRPEYLGGGRTPIIISEVLQTSSSDASSPQANMAGHGLTAGATNSFNRFFEEHGYVIGIMSILPRTAYQQGMPRHFFKFDKFDYYFPSFAHLGEQPIYKKELFLSAEGSSPGYNDEVFGYVPRYSEYKFINSRVAGDFKDTLSFWHLGRIFERKPFLSRDFVEAENIERIFAVEDSGESDKFWIQLHHNVKAIRPMPKYGTPTI